MEEKGFEEDPKSKRIAMVRNRMGHDMETRIV